MSIILKKLTSSDNLIYIAFAAAFLPFIATGIVMVALGIYLLLAKRDRVRNTFLLFNYIYIKSELILND